jgi:O-methyltransferase domain
MKKVVHDWDDAATIAILRSCRAAIPPEGRLLLAEWVIPPGNTPDFSKRLDLLMLVYTGGRERTEAEHAALLAEAGFAARRVIRTGAGLSLVEAVPA